MRLICANKLELEIKCPHCGSMSYMETEKNIGYCLASCKSYADHESDIKGGCGKQFLIKIKGINIVGEYIKIENKEEQNG